MSKINKIQVDETTYDIEDLSVPSWAKAENKPTYQYSEIQNTPDLTTKQDKIDSSHKLSSDLVDDTNNTNLFVSSEEKTTWNNKSNFSGNYNDLSNKPTIPTNSDFTLNGLSEKSYNNLTDKPTIPDVSNFITKDVDNLTNYYKKAETYTQNEIDSKLSSVYKYKGTVETYSQLPSSNLTIGDVYNVETADSTHGIKAGDNVAWNGTTWDVLAGTIDLSGYQTLIDSTHKLSADLVDDTSTTNKFVSASDKTTWNGKYDKPSGGIPSTDLSSAVQTSLGKADTAIQSSDLSSVATSGDYDDLLNKPTIPTVPTNVSAFTNDAGYTTNIGTITSVKMNGSTIASSGEADLGTVITQHQSIKTINSTSLVGTGDVAVQETLVSGTNIKTINNTSLLGSGDITISSGTPTDVQINGTSITSNNVANILTKTAYNSSTNKIATESDLPDISGKLDTTAVKTTLNTTQGNVYDVTYINSTLGDIETLLSGI